MAGKTEDRQEISPELEAQGDDAAEDKDVAGEATPKAPPAERAYTKAEVDAMLNKVRTDESRKLQTKLSELSAEKAAAAKKIEELEGVLDKAKTKDLEDAVSQGDDAKSKKAILDELAELKRKNAEFEKMVDSVAETAAAQIVELELKAHKELLIEKYGVLLPELVTGSTKEEIEESVRAAKKREEDLVAERVKKTEEAAKKKKQKDAEENLPKPIDVDSSISAGGDIAFTPITKQRLAKLPETEYQKVRAKLMAEAKRKVGMA
jgi:hypothetical protein